jgi:hypothetical protein
MPAVSVVVVGVAIGEDFVSVFSLETPNDVFGVALRRLLCSGLFLV